MFGNKSCDHTWLPQHAVRPEPLALGCRTAHAQWPGYRSVDLSRRSELQVIVVAEEHLVSAKITGKTGKRTRYLTT